MDSSEWSIHNKVSVAGAEYTRGEWPEKRSQASWVGLVRTQKCVLIAKEAAGLFKAGHDMT